MGEREVCAINPDLRYDSDYLKYHCGLRQAIILYYCFRRLAYIFFLYAPLTQLCWKLMKNVIIQQTGYKCALVSNFELSSFYRQTFGAKNAEGNSKRESNPVKSKT
jgi:hypothetical protein